MTRDVLVIDVGNSRMKWGLAGPHGWLAQGVTPNSEIGTLALRDWQNLPRPARVVGVNVAGEAARVRVEAQLARWRLVPEWLTATASARAASPIATRGPRSSAPTAGRRWSPRGGARTPPTSSRPPASSSTRAPRSPIDALDADGVFRGGLILPGLRLMLQALAENTAALKVPPGEFRDFPDNTADALYSGAVQAICGAIEQMRRQIDANPAQVRCLSRRRRRARDRAAPHPAGRGRR